MIARIGKGLLTLVLVLGLLLPGVPISGQEITDITAGLAATTELTLDETYTEDVCQVILITGDAITVATSSDGEKSLVISPADAGKVGQGFHIFKSPAGTYVIPHTADLQRLDRELFNVDYLMTEQYHEQASLPLLVTYSSTLAEPGVQALVGGIGGLGRETRLHQEVYTISTGMPYTDISASYGSLVSRPEVERVWLDKKVYVQLDDSVPLIGGGWWWTNTGNTGEGVSIAILDTGIDASHPAFEDRVVVEANFTDDPTPDDEHGHGTHCAGIAAGSAAGSQYQGVAPGAHLWNVKVLNHEGWGYQSWIIDGIDLASLGPDGRPRTGDEADVISMSLGGGPTDGTDPLSQAVNLAVERGVVVVVAAGNSGPSPLSIGTPGPAQKAITVGATDNQDHMADFSSRGPTVDWRVKPDVVAPGVDIMSAVPWGYESWSGTSMATPHVAGAAALLREFYGGGVTPQFIKDALMYTSRDLGYSIYEQGSGRLALEWEPWPTVGVTPASLSMGMVTGATAEGKFTFFPTEPAAQGVTLSVILTDSMTGDDYSEAVTLEPASFTIPAGGGIEVTLDVDLTSLPRSAFEGRIIAAIDGDSPPIHAIFGLARLNEVTVQKKDIHGEPARWHPLWVLRESPDEGIMYDWVEFDESGSFTFRAPAGTYHFISPSWWHEEAGVTIWTIAEDIVVSGDATIVLDERDTLLVDLDPQKTEQVVAGKSSGLFWEDYGWGSQWGYVPDFLTRVSPTSRLDASFTYRYYSEADFLPHAPWLVNTDEWHNLRYSVTDISGNTTFVADYDKLVQRQTRYCTALEDELAAWGQWSWDNIAWWGAGFEYGMNAPQVRTEWLSPAPVRHGHMYARAQPWGEWYFEGWDMHYGPGEHEWAIGTHPFTSGVEIGMSSDWLGVWGLVSRDAGGNDFLNLQASSSGSITITRDGTEVLHDNIGDSFSTGVDFESTPHFVVEIEGWRPLALSSNTYTRLDFMADPHNDYRPPRLVGFDVPGLDLFGVAPEGEVKVRVRVADESPLYSLSLAYSLDDGETWSDAGSPVLETGWLVFSLGELRDTLVDIVVEAQDLQGNEIHHSVKRAFRVGPWLVIRTTELPAGQMGVPYEASLKAIGGRLPYTWERVEGDLPPGLDLDSATGVVSGVPTAVGNYDFTVRVTDADEVTASQEFSVTIFTWTEFITDPEGDQLHGAGPDIVGLDFYRDEKTIYFRVRTAGPLQPSEIISYLLLDLDLNISTGFVSVDTEIPSNDIGADAAAIIFPAYPMMAAAQALPLHRADQDPQPEGEPAQSTSPGMQGELYLWDSEHEGFGYAGSFPVFTGTDYLWCAIPLDMLDDDGIMAVVNLVGSPWEGLTDVAPNEGFGATVDSGIEGFVTDAVTEEPLEGVAVSVPQTGQLKYSDGSGHYRLFLAQGSHNVTAGAFGYYEQLALVDVEEGAFTAYGFALEPMPRGVIAGNVTDMDTGDPIEGAIVTLLATPLSTSTDESGQYAIEAPIGAYNVTAWARGYWPSVAHDVDVIAGETVPVDFDLEPALASVAVLGDYDGQLTGLLIANEIWAEERGWDMIGDMHHYDAVVVNRPDDPGPDLFLEFLDVASDNEVGVVFTSSWPSRWEPYGISLLQRHLGDPAEQGDHVQASDVYLEVTQDHPIFEGWGAGDTITIIDTGERAYAWFRGYSGYTVADIGSEDVGVQGNAVALNAYGGSLHVLLAGLAPHWYANMSHWTEDARTILLRAVLAAGGLIDLDLLVATTQLHPGVVGEEYEATINVIGGAKPYTWAIVDGDLPHGVGLDTATGVISGTPAVAGTFGFTVQVTDADEATATRELSITVVIWTEFITDPEGDQFHGAGPDIVGLAFCRDEETIYFRIRTAEPLQPSEIVNYLFLDLDLDASTGFVSPYPDIPTNDIGADAVAAIYPANLMMAGQHALPLRRAGEELRLQGEQAQALSTGLQGVLWLWDSYVEDFWVVGNFPVFIDTYDLWCAIPLDMLDDDGIMAVVNLIGSLWEESFTDVAPNEGHGVTTAPLEIDTTGLPDGQVGLAYDAILEARGGIEPYTWAWTAAEGQQLPPGLNLAAETGLISGIPTEAGTFNFTVEVTDAVEDTATRDLSIMVDIWTPWSYDENSDGVIQKMEALAAVQDYFTGTITKALVLEVIQLYFAG